MSALRVAFLGAGQMARNHLSALGRISTSTVVAGVYDRSRRQADEFAALAGTTAFASPDVLFEEARPDVVHICTPPAAHADGAGFALERGAHVYVEKPFALTAGDARALLDLSSARQRLVCAGHQLLRDRAFETLLERGGPLSPLVQADSHFAFRPAGAWSARSGALALQRQMEDVLPHPLYTLVSVLERFGPPARPIEIDWVRGGSTDLQATLRAGEITGRLSVSLLARPVASTLSLIGIRGTLTCDFVRSIVVGAGNPGTDALEKVFNPIVEGLQLIGRTASSVGQRLTTGVSYPGLAELIGSFYTAIRDGRESPVSPAHLLRVAELFETLSHAIRRGAATSSAVSPALRTATEKTDGARLTPLVVLTGARGFLGSAVAGALDRVRGIGRAGQPGNPHIAEWVPADLSDGVPPQALSGADVVVHAAAETAGDFAAHQRNTIDATRHLLHAMHAAGVSRLVLISSMSVLRPPSGPWEQQDERTPRPDDPLRYGPYVWGKSEQEALVEREAPGLGIAVRIVRPGALIDWNEPELPGLMGRRLFGRWHLGLGRRSLPIAVCGVGQCAEAIAWCATHFDEAPPIVNLFDPDLMTRGQLIATLRQRGWNGRMVWLPICTISLAIVVARAIPSILRGRRPPRLAAWSVLRPRRYDGRTAARLLAACR
jgi:predicted dehydrogenase/nucleoside-diphosphate-sugar epimerase